MPPQADLSFPFDARWIAEVLQRSGSLSASSPDLNAWTHHRFSEFTTDSRKIAAHSIFVAVRGERFDGHAFIEQAIAAGATGILAKAQTIAERGYERQFPKVFFAGVTDVQAAFRRLAQAWRAQTKIPVIAVAGSNGKTTTKELLAAILEGRFHSVLKTTGSENGYLGIPITLLRLRSSHQAAVIEVGIDDVGAMTEHIDLVRPTHTVLTVIGPEHLEKLGTLETVAREELLAFSETEKNGGCSVVNLDDTWMATASEHLTQPWKFSLREITDTFSGAETCEARRVQGVGYE
jgi:UDP-N-acetylmuramyl pentapeptide synthase